MKLKRTTDYTDKVANKFSSEFIRGLVHFTFAAIFIHWIFQSVLYLDRTERLFKISIDVFLTLLVGAIVKLWFISPFVWLFAFLIAHTLNFLFNAHFWAVMRYYGLYCHDRDSFERYVEGVAERTSGEKSLVYAAAYGSLSREGWKPSSDLDLRLVRCPGWRNGLRACAFVLIERARALFLGFPLDIYVLDDFHSLKRLRVDEVPTVLSDRNNGREFQ